MMLLAQAVVQGLLMIVAFWLTEFYAPKFSVMFDSLRQTGELPFLTDWGGRFRAILHRSWFLPLAFLGFLSGPVVGFVLSYLPKKRRWLIPAWLDAGLAVMVVYIFLIILGLLLAVLKMSSEI